MRKEINHKAIIKRIVNLHQEKLNNWEVEFISSVYQWHVLDGKNLSDKQEKIILKINGNMLGRSS